MAFIKWIKSVFNWSKTVKVEPIPSLVPEKSKEKETDVPDKTQDLEAKMRLRLVELVKRDLGERETHGSNRSPLIDMINNSVNHAYIGAPYCISAIVKRGIMDLCSEMNISMPSWMNTASTQGFYNNSPAKYRRVVSAKMGDVGIQQSRSNANTGHAYLLTQDQIGSNHQTVEANTNKAGSREGDGWYLKTRSTSGDLTKKYRGSVDVVSALIDFNNLK